MRTQQEAERAEQQRIKNLVLNYDLNDDQNDGEEPSFHYMNIAGTHGTKLVGKGSFNRGPMQHQQQRGGPRSASGDQSQRSIAHEEERDVRGRDSFYATPPSSSASIRQQNISANETDPLVESLHRQPRYDKAGNTRSKQRARKLQLGDIDWYGSRSSTASATSSSTTSSSRAAPAAQLSLESYVVDKEQPSCDGARKSSETRREINQQQRHKESG